MRLIRLFSTAVFITASLFSGAQGATVPEGFTETQLADTPTDVERPVAVAFEPGTGDLWIAEQGNNTAGDDARIRRRAASDGSFSTVASFPCADSVGERGLLGIAFDPGYLDPGDVNKFVYIYYTRTIDSGSCAFGGLPSQRRNRVSRFPVLANGLGAEQVVLDGPTLTGATNHNGGTIRFAPDGTLFISMGDNDTDGASNPLSRDLNDLRGSLLRVNPDGSIPANNPFVGQAVEPSIWAWGLRNPFRFSIDEMTGIPYIADVGESNWEAIYAGQSGADYGYPCVEGSNFFRPCSPDPAPGTVVDPIYEYNHGNDTLPVRGSSITGGPVYRATEFPVEYHGDLFFGDYIFDWIRHADIGPSGLTNIQLFAEGASQLADMVVSPSGCLVWVGRGSGVFEICADPQDPDADNDGFSVGEGDCDDARDDVYPGAPELCDSRDNDCNGSTDESTCSDYDLSGDGRVDGVEIVWYGRAFTDCSTDPANEWWSDLDYDPSRNGLGESCIDGDDLSLLGTVFGCEGSEAICE